jgi:hypothetical protein
MIRNLALILRLRNLLLALASIAIVTACGGSGGKTLASTSTPILIISNSTGQSVSTGKTVDAAVDTTKTTSAVSGTYFSGSVSVGQPQTSFQ